MTNLFCVMEESSATVAITLRLRITTILKKLTFFFRKITDGKAAHIVCLYELIQELVPGGVVEVEIFSRNWELLVVVGAREFIRRKSFVIRLNQVMLRRHQGLALDHCKNEYHTF